MLEGAWDLIGGLIGGFARARCRCKEFHGLGQCTTSFSLMVSEDHERRDVIFNVCRGVLLEEKRAESEHEEADIDVRIFLNGSALVIRGRKVAESFGSIGILSVRCG